MPLSWTNLPRPWATIQALSYHSFSFLFWSGLTSGNDFLPFSSHLSFADLLGGKWWWMCFTDDPECRWGSLAQGGQSFFSSEDLWGAVIHTGLGSNGTEHAPELLLTVHNAGEHQSCRLHPLHILHPGVSHLNGSWKNLPEGPLVCQLWEDSQKNGDRMAQVCHQGSGLCLREKEDPELETKCRGHDTPWHPNTMVHDPLEIFFISTTLDFVKLKTPKETIDQRDGTEDHAMGTSCMQSMHLPTVSSP